MDIASPTAWWIACGALIAAELATGTFYLLMLALGCAAGAIAAWLGLGASAQMIAAAVVGAVSVLLWHRRRDRQRKLPAAADPDVNLDIGQTVQVDAWTPEGSASVFYRGAAWRARYDGHGTPVAGRHVIRAIDGSCLLLAPTA